MLETDRLKIRLMEEKDLELVRRLHNEFETLLYLSDPFHVSQEEQIVWFKKLSSNRHSRRYIIELKPSNLICGIIRLDRIDLINKSSEIGADIASSHRRLGIAFEAYTVFINYLFLTLGLNRLSLVTLSTNEPARTLYKKLGFQEEGIQRQAIFRNGEYQDLIMMSLIAQDRIK